jgi:hypothetical protein
MIKIVRGTIDVKVEVATRKASHFRLTDIAWYPDEMAAPNKSRPRASANGAAPVALRPCSSAPDLSPERRRRDTVRLRRFDSGLKYHLSGASLLKMCSRALRCRGANARYSEPC